MIYEQKYGPHDNETKTDKDKKEPKYPEEKEELKNRAAVRINIDDVEDFMKFHVTTNEIPISYDKTGKDIVVDWFMMDNFDSNETFWIDANGL